LTQTYRFILYVAKKYPSTTQNPLFYLMKKFIIIFILACAGLFGLSYLSYFSHLRNFIVWGKHSIYDFRTHPSNIVKASNTPQPWALDSAYNKKQISDSLIQYIESNRTIAFLVIQDGKIKYERYWNHGKDSLSGSFSAAKSIISLLIGRAIDEGKIKSVEQPVGDFLEDFKANGKEKIRIKDLLTMSSGLSWVEKDQSYFSLNARAYYGDEIADAVADFDYKEPAGQIWEYRSGDTQVLGMVLEKVYGESIAKLASEKLLQSMGMEKDALWLTDGNHKHEKSYCCFNAIARDYARFGQLILQKGNWNGQQLVSERYITEATTPASYLKDRDENMKAVDYYGYQFWILKHPSGHVVPSMNGLWGQYVYVIPEKRAIVVRLGNSPFAPHIHHFHPENNKYVSAGLEILD
jgi:CubicO group peptidase (beta-lactamase class C family)